MRFRGIEILFVMFAALSCVKEPALEVQQQEDGRFAQYDPMVHLGLQTYEGNDEPATKTTYAGEDQTYILNSVRYERINWNVDEPASPTDPPVDVVQVKVESGALSKSGKAEVDYKAAKIAGRTNRTGVRESEADTAPLSGNADDNLYWTMTMEDRYFYAVYPSPAMAGSRLTGFTVDSSDHTAAFSGAISANSTPGSPASEADRLQPYIGIKTTGTPGTPGTPASVEYMPDMTNAYMFAAARMNGKDAGYLKVPLQFKPLFSAVKLLITARDGGAKDYRLAKVELRTDLHTKDAYLHSSNERNENAKGTALGGRFKAKFDLNATGTTGDFTVDPTSIDERDTLKRLTIHIAETDRKVLNEDTLKLTFLLLPVEQTFLTVDYTFEYMEDPGLGWGDASNVKTLHRRLSLQSPGSGNSDLYTENNWFKLKEARKLYIRSGIPEIQYHFEIEPQAFFPRILSGGATVPDHSEFYLAQDYYSVVSYRDSSGILQPLKWKVTGYNETSGTGPFTLSAKPGWFVFRGDDGSYDPDADTDPYDPDSGVTSGTDPWDVPWGRGSRMDPSKKVRQGYTSFGDGHSYVYYHAGAKDNGTASLSWKPLDHYSYRDPEGNYYYPEKYIDETGTVQDHPRAKESYAYDLSQYDIYGGLTGTLKNKDALPYNTANCYVVSAPGWYRFPTVYGNAFKDGAVNSGAYTGDGLTNRLGAFKDHLDSDITQPWITYSIDDVEVIWQDAEDLTGAQTVFSGAVGSDPVGTERADRQKPFYWKDPDTGFGYIYFHVNQISSSNAVIAAKSGGKVVWSWHIWCVPDPVNTLKVAEIQNTELDYYQPGAQINVSGDVVRTPVPYAFQSVHGNTQVFKDMDLGQGIADVEHENPRYCYVEFTQYWKGKVIGKRVVCFAQSGVKDDSDASITPVYQWGRKDPLKVPATVSDSDVVDYQADGESIGSIGTAIQHPEVFYTATSEGSQFGSTRYDNLWNGNVNYYPTTFHGFYNKWFFRRNYGSAFYPSSNPFHLIWFDHDPADDGLTTISYNSVMTPQGRRDTPVRKTIYDPCPPGFVVPNLFAFTAFNNRGLLQARVVIGNVATHCTSAEWDSPENYYYDFYTLYDKDSGYVSQNSDVTDNSGSSNYKRAGYYRRRQDADNTVRFYARGQLNGNPDKGSRGEQRSGYYWLAEPAANEDVWSYGSSFYFQAPGGSGVGTAMHPVTGGSFYYNIGIKDYADGRTNNAKWQRSHGQYIRPMVEPPVIAPTAPTEP